MIPEFSVEKIKKNAARQRKNKLAMKFFASFFPNIEQPVTSVYVPIIMVDTGYYSPWDIKPGGTKEFLGLQRSTGIDALVDPKDYMWFLLRDDDAPSFTKNRTITPKIDGIIYTTLDGTDAINKLIYELKHFANAYEIGVIANTKAGRTFSLHPSDLGRSIGDAKDTRKVVFMLSAAEPIS